MWELVFCTSGSDEVVIESRGTQRLTLSQREKGVQIKKRIALLTIPCVSFLDGCLEVFVFLLEALCVCQGPGNGKPSR